MKEELVKQLVDALVPLGHDAAATFVYVMLIRYGTDVVGWIIGAIVAVLIAHVVKQIAFKLIDS